MAESVAIRSQDFRANQLATAVVLAVLFHWMGYWLLNALSVVDTSTLPTEAKGAGQGQQGISLLLGSAGRSAGSQKTTSGDNTLEQAPGEKPDPNSDARAATQKTFGPNLIMPSDLPEAAHAEVSKPTESENPLNSSAAAEAESTSEQSFSIDEEATGIEKAGDSNPAPPVSTHLATSMMAQTDDVAEPGPLESSANQPMSQISGQSGLSGNREEDGTGDDEVNQSDAAEGATAALVSYTSQVAARLAAEKVYPKYAEHRGHQGSALLNFVINRDGKVLRSELKKKTGSWILDKEINRMLERASPFPAFPDQLKQVYLELELPIDFRLEEQTTEPLTN